MRHIVCKMKSKNCVKRCNSLCGVVSRNFVYYTCVYVFLSLSLFFDWALSMLVFFYLFIYLNRISIVAHDYIFFFSLLLRLLFFTLHITITCLRFTFVHNYHSVGSREHAYTINNNRPKCSRQKWLHLMNYYYWNPCVKWHLWSSCAVLKKKNKQ